MEKNFEISDLVEVDNLQQLQDAFAMNSDIAVVVSDKYGEPITEASNYCDFCTKLNEESDLGREKCKECHKEFAKKASESNSAYLGICHAGIATFTAPIAIENEIFGYINGGQVFLEEPDLEAFHQMADGIGLDEDEYLEAYQKIQIISEEQLKKNANFMWVLAGFISKNAYTTQSITESKFALEKESKMKSDFLANMSHEIRTPMNAVIGMAELALREEMSQTARDQIHQIKASGKTLLTIINDILDYSKIEAGRMEVIEDDYELVDSINDIVHLIMARIGSKDIEFTIDMSPDLPKVFYGDSMRISQIMINLLTNAVKFTKEGNVHLKVYTEKIDKETYLFKGVVRDTGSGIRERDKEKLFQSFQQVDSKRNRSVEGTGLGLAITKNLLTMMNGSLSLESVYGKGSSFAFELPQKIVDIEPCIPKNTKYVSTAIIAKSKYLRKQLKFDLIRLGTNCQTVANIDNLNGEAVNYVFIEESLYGNREKTFLKRHPNTIGVVIADYDSLIKSDLENVRVLKRPVYSLNLAFVMNLVEAEDKDKLSQDIFSFIAPEAHILIVDDNAINLTVAKGLLEPLQMQIDAAYSAKEAIEHVSTTKYDLIFMDHMMPEVDGIEATHIIRRLFMNYSDVPIIALTANVIGGMKELYLSEGMNDLVAKPIETKEILDKLLKWLPQEKIQKVTGSIQMVDDDDDDEALEAEFGANLSATKVAKAGIDAKTLEAEQEDVKKAIESIKKTMKEKAAERARQAAEFEKEKAAREEAQADGKGEKAIEPVVPAPEPAKKERTLVIADLDTDTAVSMLGSRRLYMAVLKEYYRTIAEKANMIEDFYKKQKWRDYTIQVHSVKSASRQVGATELAKLAEALERSGNAEDVAYINKNTATFLQQYREYMVKLRDIFPDEQVQAMPAKKSGKPEATKDQVNEMLGKMKEALDSFDILLIEEVIEEMEKYKYPMKEEKLFNTLKTAVEESDMDTCEKITNLWSKI